MKDFPAAADLMLSIKSTTVNIDASLPPEAQMNHVVDSFEQLIKTHLQSQETALMSLN